MNAVGCLRSGPSPFVNQFPLTAISIAVGETVNADLVLAFGTHLYIYQTPHCSSTYGWFYVPYRVWPWMCRPPVCITPSQIPDKANLLDGPVPILKLYLPDVPVLSRERYLPKYTHELF